jgi:hypothetical protein
MITLTDFITKYNNKYVEVVDPTNYAQCFDLVLQWCVELGIPKTIFPFLNAYQIYTGFGTQQAQYFTRHVNGPNDIPKEGDILVWGNSYNYAGGHTGIFKSGDVWTLNAFEQNDPTKTPSHLKIYNYNYILGWLRPKVYHQQLTDSQKLAKIKSWVNDTTIPDSDCRAKIKQLLV